LFLKTEGFGSTVCEKETKGWTRKVNAANAIHTYCLMQAILFKRACEFKAVKITEE
jgi:hypothetical protein